MLRKSAMWPIDSREMYPRAFWVSSRIWTRNSRFGWQRAKISMSFCGGFSLTPAAEAEESCFFRRFR
jgi:hypothetical protein